VKRLRNPSADEVLTMNAAQRRNLAGSFVALAAILVAGFIWLSPAAQNAGPTPEEEAGLVNTPLDAYTPPAFQKLNTHEQAFTRYKFGIASALRAAKNEQELAAAREAAERQYRLFPGLREAVAEELARPAAPPAPNDGPSPKP